MKISVQPLPRRRDHMAIAERLLTLEEECCLSITGCDFGTRSNKVRSIRMFLRSRGFLLKAKTIDGVLKLWKIKQ